MLIATDPVYVAVLTADEILAILQSVDEIIAGEFFSADEFDYVHLQLVREKLWNCFNRADLRSEHPTKPLPNLRQ